jgi:hypothetical protein
VGRRKGEGFFELVSRDKGALINFLYKSRTISNILPNYYLRDDAIVFPYINWSDESWKLGKGFPAAQCSVRALP